MDYKNQPILKTTMGNFSIAGKISLILLLVLIITNFTYYMKQVNDGLLLQYTVCIVGGAFLLGALIRIPRLISGWFCVFLFTLIAYFISSFLSEISGYGFVVYYALAVLLLLTYSEREDYFPWIVRFYLILSIVFVFGTAFSVLFPSAYLRVLPYLFKYEFSEIVSGYLAQHCYGGFAGLSGVNAYFLSVGMGITFVMIITRVSRSRWLMPILVLLILSIFFTQRRMGIIANLTAVLFLLMFKRKYFSKVLIAALVIFIAYCVVRIYIPWIDSVFTKNEELAHAGDFTNGRQDLYDFAWRLFKENPVFGKGPLTYVELRQHYTGDYESSLGVHNSYLQLLSEVGWVGTSLFLLGVVVLLVKSVNGIRRAQKKNDAKSEFFLMTSLYVQVVFLAFCMTESAVSEYNMFFTYTLFCTMPLFYSKFYD